MPESPGISKRFKSKEVEVKKMQESDIFICADGSLRPEGHAQRQTLRHQGVESFDEENPLLWARRGVTLCQKKGEADRDAMEAREDFWSMSGNLISLDHIMLREQLYLPNRVMLLNSF